MLHLPVHQRSPGLLAHPAAAAAAVNQLEGGQVVGLIAQFHETAGLEQFHHVAGGAALGGTVGRAGCVRHGWGPLS